MHSLVDEITQENAWRYGEFAKLKVNANQVEPALWCRMCVPIIYANWEGFVVSSLKILLGYLNSLNLEPIKVHTRLIVLGLGETYKTLSGKQSFNQRCEFTDSFNKLFNSTIRFTTKINTKSNLKSNVLEELCLIFDFDFSKFDNVKSTLDRLVNVRNSIAHGENSVLPNQQNIIDYIDAVNKSMDALTNEISRFLEFERYLC